MACAHNTIMPNTERWKGPGDEANTVTVYALFIMLKLLHNYSAVLS